MISQIKEHDKMQLYKSRKNEPRRLIEHKTLEYCYKHLRIATIEKGVHAKIIASSRKHEHNQNAQTTTTQ